MCVIIYQGAHCILHSISVAHDFGLFCSLKYSLLMICTVILQTNHSILCKTAYERSLYDNIKKIFLMSM